MNLKKAIGLFASVELFIASTSFGQFEYQGCANLSTDDLKGEYIYQNNSLDLSEPLKMAFDMRSMEDMDIYFIERYGKIKMYSSLSGNVTALATLSDVTAGPSGNNDGLIGIALDPDFKENGWIYLTYSRNTPSVFRLSRFKISDGQFDVSSELPILDIPSQRGFWHTGGDLAFDEYGDLWWSVGDNTTYTGPANTNDLRGKILRIHPIAVPDGEKPQMGVGSTYEIPEGNLFPESQDTQDKTRPEIYIMGTRNPYTIALDPVRRWIAWGEVGPDWGMVTEEHNLFTQPGNAGWPFFAGNNLQLEGKGDRYDEILDPINPAAPVNYFSGNTGLTNLPPAIPATHYYQQSCAISGPIYRYDPALESDVKLPPHFNRTWFMSDCNGGGNFWAAKVDEQGKLASAVIDIGVSLMGGLNFKTPLDFETGPDGALYVMFYNGNYGSGPEAGIFRISYQGQCQPQPGEFPAIEKVGCMDSQYSDFDATATHPGECKGSTGLNMVSKGNGLWKWGANMELEILDVGLFHLEVRNIMGELVFSKKGDGKQTIRLEELEQGSMYVVQLKSQAGVFSQKLLPLGQK